MTDAPTNKSGRSIELATPAACWVRDEPPSFSHLVPLRTSRVKYTTSTSAQKRMRFGIVLIVNALLVIPRPVAAQDTSKVEFSVGRRWYHVTLNSVVKPKELVLPQLRGWYADVSANLSPTFAVVGEVGGTSFSLENTAVLGLGAVSIHESYDLKFHTVMGGVRVRVPRVRWLVPFGQALFGQERDTSSNERMEFVRGVSLNGHDESSSSNAALAFDSGATIAVGPVGVRGAVGYVRFFNRADANAFRFNLGVVLRL